MALALLVYSGTLIIFVGIKYWIMQQLLLLIMLFIISTNRCYLIVCLIWLKAYFFENLKVFMLI